MAKAQDTIVSAFVWLFFIVMALVVIDVGISSGALGSLMPSGGNNSFISSVIAKLKNLFSQASSETTNLAPGTQQAIDVFSPLAETQAEIRQTITSWQAANPGVPLPQSMQDVLAAQAPYWADIAYGMGE
jgi:hypothetical protein